MSFKKAVIKTIQNAFLVIKALIKVSHPGFRTAENLRRNNFRKMSPESFDKVS